MCMDRQMSTYNAWGSRLSIFPSAPEVLRLSLNMQCHDSWIKYSIKYLDDVSVLKCLILTISY